MSERLGALEAARALVAARGSGQAVALVKLLTGEFAGSHLLMYADGRSGGTLGSAELDQSARELGHSCLLSGEPELMELESGERLFCEPQLAGHHLVIVGAGHIAVPLAELGSMIGFAVTVLDDREEFASTERFPPAVTVQRMDFEQPFEQVRLDARSYVVLVTRAHKYDFDCLRVLLSRSERPGYIGMIGSRRRVRAAFHALLESGVSAERLALVKAPLGLDIGAETPAEIAVSIAAELIHHRSGTGTAQPLGEAERVLERFFATREPDA